MVEKILGCYGQEIRIQGLDRAVFGFLQSVRGKGQQLVLKDVGPLGLEQTGQYVYIGPVEPELQEGDILEAAGKGYVVRRCEKVWATGGAVYQWGMCVERGGSDTWGSNG